MAVSHVLRKSSPLAVAAATLSLASCAIPPREAWQRIKEDGLISFVAESIAHPGHMPPPLHPAEETPATEPAATPAEKTPATTAIASSETHHTPAAPAPVMTGSSRPVTAHSAPPAQQDQHPVVAKSVPSLPGFVRSPYTNPPRLVDAKGATPGSTMVCPYTQRPFIIPNDFANPSTVIASSAPTMTSPPPINAPRQPTPPPTVAKNEPTPQTPAGALFNGPTRNSATAPVKPVAAHDIPYGTPIPGRPGFVNSPWAAKHQLVDVTGLPPGMEVKCPYTGKLFRVPSSDVAEQKGDSAPAVAAPETPQKK